MKKSFWAVLVVLIVCFSLVIPVQAANVAMDSPLAINAEFQGVSFKYERTEISNQVKGMTADDVLFGFSDKKMRTIVYFSTQGPLTSVVGRDTFLKVTYTDADGKQMIDAGSLETGLATYYYGLSTFKSDETNGRVAFMFDGLPEGSVIDSIEISEKASDKEVLIYQK